MGYQLKQTFEFKNWLQSQHEKGKGIIRKRLFNIEAHEHFGDFKKVHTQGDYDISELRFKNGTRIYFAFLIDSNGQYVLLLLGGNKNGQSKDIKKAETILDKWYAALKSVFG